jgi:hypothetical protein
VVHAVSLPPLPSEKLKPVKSKTLGNTGIIKVLNFNLKVFDIKEKIRKLATKNLNEGLDGSVDSKEDENSSYLHSDLHRKIVEIKKASGVKTFHVRRYSGEPTMNPRPNVREFVETVADPPPKPIYQLFSIKNPQKRPEADNPIRDDEDSFVITSQEEDDVLLKL